MLPFSRRDALVGCTPHHVLGTNLSCEVTGLFRWLLGAWHQIGLGVWGAVPAWCQYPEVVPSSETIIPPPFPAQRLPQLLQDPNWAIVTCPPFSPHPEHPFLPIPDVAHGRCGPAGAGSGCLPWLPPCLDFSPVTNPCPGPSALTANSSLPSLPALMSSRLSALPENLPGHAARLHLGDLVTIISSPWGWGLPSCPERGAWQAGEDGEGQGQVSSGPGALRLVCLWSRG